MVRLRKVPLVAVLAGFVLTVTAVLSARPIASGEAPSVPVRVAPTVTSVTPNTGLITGGTPIVIRGTGFAAAIGIRFDAFPLLPPPIGFTIVSDTEIQTLAPGTGVGFSPTPGVPVDVIVANALFEESAPNVNAKFTYFTKPILTSISPSSGPLAGGNTVTIEGVSLTGSTSVRFGATAATSFTVVSDTQMTAVAPAGTGAVDITITHANGTSDVVAGGRYTYAAAPTLTSVAPATGPAAGGTAVTLTGTGFTNASGVTFGGAAATGVTVNSATEITATTPAGTAGTASVIVTTPGGTNAANTLFTYTASAPTVSMINPATGPASGGTVVTITGTNFVSGATVTFGAVASPSVSFDSATTLRATSPAGNGTVNLRVTTPGGNSTTTAADQFTYISAPTVTSVTPNNGPVTGGTDIAITGTNLTGATQVTVGGAAATGVIVNGTTSITARTPAGTAGTASVIVTTPGGTNPANTLFTYTPVAPTVSMINPATGPTSGGTVVTITGTNFVSGATVTFGAVASPSVSFDSATTLRATSPAGNGTVNLRVTTSGGNSTTTAADRFTYVSAPTVTSVTPNNGPVSGGTDITITGTNLTGATQVTVGGAAATGVIVNGTTSITARTPAGTAGTASVIVTTPGGTNAANTLFTYTASAPTVSMINPAAGPASGGTVVTITGTNFVSGATVTFGAVASPSVSFDSATTLRATSPAGNGTVNLRVTTPGGNSTTTTADRFTYVSAPTVTSVTPSIVSTAGGTPVTITGTSLDSVTLVQIGNSTVTFVKDSSTRISTAAPAQPAGLATVTVTNPAGSATGTVTYQTPGAGAPQIFSISPQSGPTAGGTRVSVTGTNFTGVTEVRIGSAAAASFNVTSTNLLVAVTPANAANSAGSVSVTTLAGTASSSQAFSWCGTPTVDGLSPSPAPAGSQVTVSGTNFCGPVIANFRSLAGRSINMTATVVSPVRALVNAPSISNSTSTQMVRGMSFRPQVSEPSLRALAAPTSWEVSVITGGGVSAPGPGATIVVIPVPQITAVDPGVGSITGGTSVTLTGLDLTGVTSVSFGSVPAMSFVVNSDTQITATTPAQAAGTVNVTVVGPGGTSTPTINSRFLYMVSVPTMGEWFMILLALLLGGTGYWTLRRRQHTAQA